MPNGLRFVPLLSIASLLLFSVVGCRRQAEPVAQHPALNPLEAAIHADADAGHLSILHWPDFTDYKPAAWTLYSKRNWDSAWVHGHKATEQATELMELFAASGSKGLNPTDYDASLWPTRLHQLATANDEQLAAFDMALTICTMRYISDLHIGRVNPQHFTFGVDVEARRYDLSSFLAGQVLAAANVQVALNGIEPDSDNYRATESALVHYQELTRRAEDTPLLPMPTQPLSPGAHYAGVSALGERLALLGDMDLPPLPDTAELPAPSPVTNPVYTQALAEGVKNFQLRHDLPASGLLTPQTVAALNVPLTTRVHQLEDTLERLRWLAPEYQNAPVFVNIPEYLLRVYGDDHKPAFQMRVVVGQAKEDEHKTPVLSQEMRYVVLRPYWNVTPTILKEELIPHVEANKDYLASKNFEVVNHAGKPVEGWTAESLAKNLYMVREKPGPENSLGLIKFMFPNKLNIYLHSTPAVGLFSRSRRDFSHGCVRIQNPEALADWVLRDQPHWSPDAIHDAMETGEDNKTVGLKHPIPVLIFYATARVDEAGKVHFFNDLYGYDKDMESILAGGAPYPLKPEPKKITGDTT